MLRSALAHSVYSDIAELTRHLCERHCSSQVHIVACCEYFRMKGNPVEYAYAVDMVLLVHGQSASLGALA